ncbi:hypothetical protein HAX54_035305 [Datura stramonium]|uniref:Uncharacterized protein n=1 Tax=Datura stramonium TaxID=4076 RepID=A0ABS8RLZ9_DATST|nr:hypothetical protein [Datura stramonium]
MYKSIERVCRDEGTDSDSSTSVSKSSGSTLMQIDSITIDLNPPISAKEKGECQHFSIRGYVAEMRNKDMKICSPFGSSRKPEEQLPPLDVPKFKWWLCDKCLQEIGASHESAGDESDGASVHTGSTAVVAHILLELEYMFDSRKCDKSKEIMDDAADTSENEDNMSYDPLRSNVFEPGQSLGQGVNSLVRQSNLFETGQYSKQGVNLYVRPPNVTEIDKYSRKGVDPLVNVAEVDHYSRKGVNPLVNMVETDQYLQKGVQSQLRQTNLSESGQPLRKIVIDLNQGIDLNQCQGIESSLNLLHRGNLQIQNPMETPCSSIKINLNEVQGYSYVTKPQQNQWPNTIMEKGPSDYVRPMGIVEMLTRNPHEGIHPQTQSNWRIGTNENGVHTWLNPGSTSFHPVYANDVGELRYSAPHLSNVKVNSAEIIQVREQLFRLFNTSTQSQQKPSNGVQVSAPVPTRWGLQHGEGSNFVCSKLPTTCSLL